ncbi:protein PNS1-like [Neltuma alba]|uniref:protein PNS1-like n=1 Tax=Neltuma alba TaxID=207710 RepID=UPI0010A449D9|nr:protein PNS1-like [Prosopis alba]
MTILSSFNDTRGTQSIRVQVQDDRLPHANPVQGQDSGFPNRTVARQISTRVFKILFLSHILFIAVLTIFLTIYGLISASRNHQFHPSKWYPPLLSSTASAGIVAFTCQWITARRPSKAIKAAFWLSPLLTLATGVMFVYIESALGMVAGVVALVSALIQSLYGCWVSPRFEYATRILSISLTFPPARIMGLVFSSILAGILYCCFLVAGIGGAKAIESKTKLAALFILVILLSLGWTMQFLKNVLQVSVSRIMYMNFACGVHIDTRAAIYDTIKYLTGSVSIGSILVPLIGLFRGFARSMSLVGGDTDEFMFSCVSCYMGIASTLVRHGNRWGFVYVGAYNKGIVQSSSDTWEMFNRVGLEQLIDSDLTGSFCFFCGVAGGAISSLMSGIWTILLHRNYAAETSVYAFLIGYFMVSLLFAYFSLFL